MYNRYSLHIDDEFSPVPAFAGPQDRPGGPGQTPPPRPHDPPHHRPPRPDPPAHRPPPPPPIHTPKDPCDDASLFGSLKSLLGNFHIPKLELDDILLLAIAYLILRESGDDDLILILAALFFFGLFD